MLVYAWNMQVYTGKFPGETPEKNPGMRVVLHKAGGLNGHNFTRDNFFTLYALGKELLKRKVPMLGTVRKNKPELSSELFVMNNRKVTSSMFAFNEKATVVSYCRKEGKHILSTVHKDAGLSTREYRKPQMVLDYNETIGDVDNFDKVTATYTC